MPQMRGIGFGEIKGSFGFGFTRHYSCLHFPKQAYGALMFCVFSGMKNALKHLKCFLGAPGFWMWTPQLPTCELGRKRHMHVWVPVWVKGVQGTRTEAVGRRRLLFAA